MLRLLLILVVPLALLPGLSDAARAQERGKVVLSGGLFDVADHQDVPEVGVEWRGRPLAWKLRLNLGAMVNADSGYYAYAGLRRDFLVSEYWGLDLGIAGGAYGEGDGLDLGGTFQFKTSIELFRDLSEHSRLGLGFYHLSHAGIYGDENPGANSIVLLFGFEPGSAN